MFALQIPIFTLKTINDLVQSFVLNLQAVGARVNTLRPTQEDVELLDA